MVSDLRKLNLFKLGKGEFFAPAVQETKKFDAMDCPVFLTRQVSPHANQDNTYKILKTKTKQKFSLYCLRNCKSSAKFSITFRAVNENSSIFTQFDMLLLLRQN